MPRGNLGLSGLFLGVYWRNLPSLPQHRHTLGYQDDVWKLRQQGAQQGRGHADGALQFLFLVREGSKIRGISLSTPEGEHGKVALTVYFPFPREG